jgi:hypothetical protein
MIVVTGEKRETRLNKWAAVDKEKWLAYRQNLTLGGAVMGVISEDLFVLPKTDGTMFIVGYVAAGHRLTSAEIIAFDEKTAATKNRLYLLGVMDYKYAEWRDKNEGKV